MDKKYIHHVVSIFEEYMIKHYNPNDYIITFDYTPFYTELPKDFIFNKLTIAYNIFMKAKLLIIMELSEFN